MSQEFAALANPEVAESLAERMFLGVAITSAEKCWNWRKKATCNGGYGAIQAGKRSVGKLRAHRLAYVLTYGEIPDGHHVCHRCDNPRCCNPAHLFAGTDADNLRDMREKGRGSKPPLHIGEKHPHATTTERQVHVVRRLFADGFSRAAAGYVAGVSPRVAEAIISGKAWSHVA